MLLPEICILDKILDLGGVQILVFGNMVRDPHKQTNSERRCLGGVQTEVFGGPPN